LPRLASNCSPPDQLGLWALATGTWLVPAFKEELTSVRLKFFHKIGSQYYAYPQMAKNRKTLKETYRSISLRDINTKILNKVSANQIQQHMKRLYIIIINRIRNKNSNHFQRCRKSISLYDKSPEETGNRRNIPHHNKNCLLPMYNQHYSK
jgi:hypothetical protein